MTARRCAACGRAERDVDHWRDACRDAPVAPVLVRPVACRWLAYEPVISLSLAKNACLLGVLSPQLTGGDW